MLRIRELRSENEKTQGEMAQILDISRQVYANYENEVNEPPFEILIKMADFFACSLDYLLGRSDDLGNVAVYQETDKLTTLSKEEQKIIDVLRKSTPTNANEWITMYAELPQYMQESIFAELKGMYLGYSASKSKKLKEGV
ncbi:MAG: helix-turn-helix transcriptional regulator [Clostridia bacterium]|nr:helix-turn-helix transcriptional regulator [Clostridia bacterium]